MSLRITSTSPECLRLAYRFWIELGRPTRFHNQKTLNAWSKQMDGLYRRSGLDYEGFRWFLIWALRPDDPDGARYGNDFTAKNLRSARDPMASLVRQFDLTFEIFADKAEKVVPRLKAQREKEDASDLCEFCSEPALRGRTECQSCFDEWNAVNEPLPCEQCGQTAADGTDLCFPCLDNLHTTRFLAEAGYLTEARFLTKDHHVGPKAGESIDEWIDREFAEFRDPDWRCPNCGYGGNPDPDAERTAWCPDCMEERLMDEEDDKEWMCFEPAESSSALDSPDMLPGSTEDGPWGSETVGAKARWALLRHTVEMYNMWLAGPMDSSRIVTSDLSQWAQEDDLRTIIWLSALNRDGRMRDHFPSVKSAKPRFTSLHVYREIAHARALEQHRLVG